MEKEPEVEPIEGESQVTNTGRLLVSFVEPRAFKEYWWILDDTGEVLRWGTEMLGKDF